MVDSVAPPRMNLRQLRYFARVVEAENITRAAQQLFVAQPALGLQIRQLEESLGVALLDRHSRGVSVTRAGQLLYERACEILRLVDDTELAVIAAGRLESEKIVLGLTTGVMSLLGRDIIVEATQAFPGIDLSLLEGTSRELMDALDRGGLDLVIAYDVHERAGLLRVPLIEEDLIFVTAAGDGADEAPIEFEQVVAHMLVMPGPRDVLREQLEATARRLALPLKVALDVSSISARKSLVMHGDASTIMAYCTVFSELESGRLRARRIVNPPLRERSISRDRCDGPSSRARRNFSTSSDARCFRCATSSDHSAARSPAWGGRCRSPLSTARPGARIRPPGERNRGVRAAGSCRRVTPSCNPGCCGSWRTWCRWRSGRTPMPFLVLASPPRVVCVVATPLALVCCTAPLPVFGL